MSHLVIPSPSAKYACALLAKRFSLRSFLAVTTLIVLALTAFSFKLLARKSNASAGSLLTAGAPQQRPTPSPLEAEVIVLRNRGFEPAEITRTAGPFLLAVDVRLGANEADLVLDRLAGSRVRERKLPVGRRAWRELLDLPPGKYVLTATNRPNAVCTITIKPR